MHNSCLLASLLTLISVQVVADEPTFNLSATDRAIIREPEYENQPHYALFVFGPDGGQHSWLVIDGESVAYVDRNGDGDITDPEDRVQMSEKLKFSNASAFLGMHRFPLGELHGTKLDFDLWVRNPDFQPTEEQPYPDHLREWDHNNWVNGSLMRTAKDGSRSQNPLLLTPDPESAQISRFGGPVSIGLKWGERQRLEAWPKRFVFDVHLGHQNRQARGCNEDGFRMTRFTTAEVPDAIVPVARFEYSAAGNTNQRVMQEVRLEKRCCGDTFYAVMTLPHKVTGRTAKVTVQVMDWTGNGSQSSEFAIPIREGVSPRSEAVYVLFAQDDFNINDAVGALRKGGLDVFIQPEALLVHENGRPAYSIELHRNDEVKTVAAALGSGSEHEAPLRQCNVRLDVGIIDSDASLASSGLLNRISTLLQELTHGFVYQTWDQQLNPPH